MPKKRRGGDIGRRTISAQRSRAHRRNMSEEEIEAWRSMGRARKALALAKETEEDRQRRLFIQRERARFIRLSKRSTEKSKRSKERSKRSTKGRKRGQATLLGIQKDLIVLEGIEAEPVERVVNHLNADVSVFQTTSDECAEEQFATRCSTQKNISSLRPTIEESVEEEHEEQLATDCTAPLLRATINECTEERYGEEYEERVATHWTTQDDVPLLRTTIEEVIIKEESEEQVAEQWTTHEDVSFLRPSIGEGTEEEGERVAARWTREDPLLRATIEEGTDERLSTYWKNLSFLKPNIDQNKDKDENDKEYLLGHTITFFCQPMQQRPEVALYKSGHQSYLAKPVLLSSGQKDYRSLLEGINEGSNFIANILHQIDKNGYV